MKYLKSKQSKDSQDLIVLIHGLEASKKDWITPGGFTSGGSLTALLAAYPDLPVTAVHMASPVPQEAMDDEYSFHNNIDLFKKTKLHWHCGTSDEENDEGEVERVFGLVPSTDKKLYWYDAGHSLPFEWTKSAARDIESFMVDNSRK